MEKNYISWGKIDDIFLREVSIFIFYYDKVYKCIEKHILKDEYCIVGVLYYCIRFHELVISGLYSFEVIEKRKRSILLLLLFRN